MYVLVAEIGDVGLVIPQYKDVEFVNPIVKIVKVDAYYKLVLTGSTLNGWHQVLFSVVE